MEDVLDVYHLPYDPLFPLVCMDESNQQLGGEVHDPLPPAPGRGQILDHEYVRNGVAEIFLEVESLAGRRHVEITEIELSALNSQCLSRRIPDFALMRTEVAAWGLDRNNRAAKIDWQFTTRDARIKLKRLYPKF